MLRSLSIKNIALIETIDLEFDDGLNIITGETGAGKSIIIDAFLAALGERASSELIRHGAQRGVVEAQFLIKRSEVHEFLKNHDLEDLGDTLIMRRELSIKGNSRSFINDTPVTLATLRECGNLLVDFHGQHEHQQILKASEQLRIVDHVARHRELVQRYQDLYEQCSTLHREYKDVLAKEQELRFKRDFQQAQLEELDRIDAREGEDLEIEAELSLLGHAEDRHSLSEELCTILQNMDQSAHDLLVRARDAMSRLAQIDERCMDLKNELDAAQIAVDEIAKSMQRYQSQIEFSPERIEQLRERSVVLQRLRKRYGSLNEACLLRERLQQELSFIDGIDVHKEQLLFDIAAMEQELGSLATTISANRRKAASVLEERAVAELQDLGINHPQFSVQIDQELVTGDASDVVSAKIAKKRYKAFAKGIDVVEFKATMNRGEDLKSLEKVLSGGEASRLMLALKSIVADLDDVQLMVFDEIDVGVSGRIARRVGAKMKHLSESRQIIAITHQAQIASLADAHFMVTKEQDAQSSHVHASRLKGNQQIEAVAALLSGETITAASLKSARELMTEVVQ